jgi:hypothetical protein
MKLWIVYRKADRKVMAVFQLHYEAAGYAETQPEAMRGCRTDHTYLEPGKGFDMLEVITLQSNLMALAAAMYDLPYGMKFTFTPEEITRANIVIDTWLYIAKHKLPELNHFSLTEN